MLISSFEKELADRRARLLAHPVYDRLTDLGAVRLFMSTHVFAVWDFMSLLKSLQRRLTCVDVPWFPAADPRAARLINEIVLVEESDELPGGGYASHFELYLGAMAEIGADRGPIDDFLDLAREEPGALQSCEARGGAFAFVATTLELASREPHAVAAAFLYGREDVIPEMFLRILDRLPVGERIRFPLLLRYLERHVEIDGGSHGPLARELLVALCGSDPMKWNEALSSARVAIDARISLWDSVMRAFEDRKGPADTDASGVRGPRPYQAGMAQ